jgi:hypothetical protein
MGRPEVRAVEPVIEAAISVSPACVPVVVAALIVAGMPRPVLVPGGMCVIPRPVPVCVVLVIALIIVVPRIVLARLALPRC